MTIANPVSIISNLLIPHAPRDRITKGHNPTGGINIRYIKREKAEKNTRQEDLGFHRDTSAHLKISQHEEIGVVNGSKRKKSNWIIVVVHLRNMIVP